MADVMEPYVGDRVLEVGAGTGNMSVNLMPRTIYWATDVNPAYLEYLVTLRSTRPYMRVAHTDAMDAATFPTGQQFDTVVCLNVVEHVQDDVAALRNIWNALEIGGRAVILVPCGQWLYGSLDEVLGHFRRYTEKQLRDVAVQAGFRVEQMLKFNSAGSPGVVVERTDSPATNFRDCPDSNIELPDAALPSGGSMAASSTAFPDRRPAKRRRRRLATVRNGSRVERSAMMHRGLDFSWDVRECSRPRN